MQNDLIDELLKEQEQVIQGLDELNERIELVLKSLAPPKAALQETVTTATELPEKQIRRAA